MRRLLLAITLLSALTLQAKKWTPDEIKDMIRKVNIYWQTNNPAEVRSFWDNAAYHTGNMEVYKLLQDQQMLDYSIRWAEHNQWKGATEPDPAKWKYKNYGEGRPERRRSWAMRPIRKFTTTGGGLMPSIW